MASPYDIFQQQYGTQADTFADQYGIPRPIFQALIQKESSWNIGALGTSGEYGLTQLMAGTASDLGVNRYDPISNLKGGAQYLSQQFKQFGNWGDALAAYNAGAGNIQAGQGYATDVLGIAKTLGYNASAAPSSTSATPTAEKIPIFGMTFEVPGIGDLGKFLFGALDVPAQTAQAAGSVVQGAAQIPGDMYGIAQMLMSADFWRGALWYIVGFVAVVALVIFGISQLL